MNTYTYPYIYIHIPIPTCLCVFISLFIKHTKWNPIYRYLEIVKEVRNNFTDYNPWFKMKMTFLKRKFLKV